MSSTSISSDQQLKFRGGYFFGHAPARLYAPRLVRPPAAGAGVRAAAKAYYPQKFEFGSRLFAERYVVVYGGRRSVVLRIDSLTKHYGDQLALEHIGFSLHAGEVLGLIGPNGAGKTTLLESIAGLLPIDSGQIFFHGHPLPAQLRRDAIFYLPDDIRPYADQVVEHVLAFFANVYRRSANQISDVVATVGLGPVLGKRIRALSKGYNRRLIIALGFLTPHPILLMDEPFDGFDLRQTRDMMGVLRRVASGGRTLLLSIHQLRDAEQVCDRFVLLAGGRIRGVGTLPQLQTQTGQSAAHLEDIFLALT
jgi:ABC-2 type transport system ATP-binding protein